MSNELDVKDIFARHTEPREWKERGHEYNLRCMSLIPLPPTKWEKTVRILLVVIVKVIISIVIIIIAIECPRPKRPSIGRTPMKSKAALSLSRRAVHCRRIVIIIVIVIVVRVI